MGHGFVSFYTCVYTDWLVRFAVAIRSQVLEKEKEVITMLHKIGRLEEALKRFTDFRQADAEQYTDWGQAKYYNAESGAGSASGSGS